MASSSRDIKHVLGYTTQRIVNTAHRTATVNVFWGVFLRFVLWVWVFLCLVFRFFFAFFYLANIKSTVKYVGFAWYKLNNE